MCQTMRWIPYMPTIQFINILLGFCVVSESNGKDLQPVFCIDPLSSRLQSKMVQEQKVRQQKQYRGGMYFVKELLLSYVPLQRYSSCLQSRDRVLLLQDPKYLVYLTFCTWHWEQEGQFCSTASDIEKYPEKGEIQWYRKISRENRDQMGHPRAWCCCWPQELWLFQWALCTEVVPETKCMFQLWKVQEYKTWVSFLKEARMSLVWAMCRKKKE